MDGSGPGIWPHAPFANRVPEGSRRAAAKNSREYRGSTDAATRSNPVERSKSATWRCILRRAGRTGCQRPSTSGTGRSTATSPPRRGTSTSSGVVSAAGVGLRDRVADARGVGLAGLRRDRRAIGPHQADERHAIPARGRARRAQAGADELEAAPGVGAAHAARPRHAGLRQELHDRVAERLPLHRQPAVDGYPADAVATAAGGERQAGEEGDREAGVHAAGAPGCRGPAWPHGRRQETRKVVVSSRSRCRRRPSGRASRASPPGRPP